MKIIRRREIDRLFAENLTEEEIRKYAEISEAFPYSFDDMKRGSDIQVPLFLKAVRCYCVGSVVALRDEALAVCEKMTGGDVSKYPQKRLDPEYRLALQRLSARYARKRKCHLNLQSFVCYCDEHKH